MKILVLCSLCAIACSAVEVSFSSGLGTKSKSRTIPAHSTTVFAQVDMNLDSHNQTFMTLTGTEKTGETVSFQDNWEYCEIRNDKHADCNWIPLSGATFKLTKNFEETHRIRSTTKEFYPLIISSN